MFLGYRQILTLFVFLCILYVEIAYEDYIINLPLGLLLCNNATQVFYLHSNHL